MGFFGWSYPPGCNSVPGDEDSFCEMCGHNVDDCVCPECPECSQMGDKKCYSKHGLKITAEQIEGLLLMEDCIDRQVEMDKAEAEYYQSVEPLLESMFDDEPIAQLSQEH